VECKASFLGEHYYNLIEYKILEISQIAIRANGIDDVSTAHAIHSINIRYLRFLTHTSTIRVILSSAQKIGIDSRQLTVRIALNLAT